MLLIENEIEFQTCFPHYGMPNISKNLLVTMKKHSKIIQKNVEKNSLGEFQKNQMYKYNSQADQICWTKQNKTICK